MKRSVRNHQIEARRNRKIASLADNLRAIRIPRQWLRQTVKLLSQIHAGSFAVKNRYNILAPRPQHVAVKSTKTQASRNPWRPKKTLVQLPAYSRAEAWGRRLILQCYQAALANRRTPMEAERIARAVSLLIFDKALCGKSVRRLASAVERRGGILLARIEAFATERSVPHPGNGKAKK